MRPETKVENHLSKRAKDAGGMAIKFLPAIAGVPDRLVILPGGRLFLVELKAPGGRVRPVQRVMHERLERIGLLVPVLSSKDEVDTWMASVIDSA